MVSQVASKNTEIFAILEVLENVEKVGRAAEQSQVRQEEYNMCP